jgi:hypothetical protein
MPTVRKITHLPKGIYRGVVAEDWDGRSKKVLVSASIGSTSSAHVHALVEKTSSLEAGTPVLLKQIHGQVYIVSGTGRLGRLCEDFDRTADDVNITAYIGDEDGVEVWGDSPHELEWSWEATVGDNPPGGNDLAGIDANGAYVLAATTDTDIYVETPQNAIILDYAFDIYLRFKTKHLGNEKFQVDFISSEDDPDAFVRVKLYLAAGEYQILTKGTDSGHQPFTFEKNVWYWLRVSYSPGDSTGIALWEDTGIDEDEPETNLYEHTEEDGAYIPVEINRIQLGYLNLDPPDKITLSSIRIFGHCLEWFLGNPRDGDPCGPTPTLTYFCGYEHRDHTLGWSGMHGDNWGANFVAADIVTSPVRTGNRSVKVEASASGFGNWVRAIGGTPTIVSRFYIYVPSTSTPRTIAFWIANANAGSDGGLWLETNFKIQGIIGSTVVEMADAISFDTWHRIDVAFDCTNNPRLLRWMVDGAEQTTVSVAEAPTTLSTRQYGFVNTLSGGGAIMYFDDHWEGTSLEDYPFGPGQVEPCLPNADGAHSVGSGSFHDYLGNVIGSGSNNAWSFLNYGMFITAPRVEQWVVDTSAYLEFLLNFPSASTRIFGIEPHISNGHDGFGQSTDQEVHLIVGGNDLTFFSGDPGTDQNGPQENTGAFYRVNPLTGEEWKRAELKEAKIRWGFSADATPDTNLYNAYIEIATRTDDCEDTSEVDDALDRVFTVTPSIASGEVFGIPTLLSAGPAFQSDTFQNDSFQV